MNEAAMTRRLSELIKAIAPTPFAGLNAPPSQGAPSSEAAGKPPSLDSSIDHLRLQIKYLLFDLEATRRENRYLRQMLESRNKRDVDDYKGDEADTA